jgi:hypothetical protein
VSLAAKRFLEESRAPKNKNKVGLQTVGPLCRPGCLLAPAPTLMSSHVEMDAVEKIAVERMGHMRAALSRYITKFDSSLGRTLYYATHVCDKLILGYSCILLRSPAHVCNRAVANPM